VHNWLARVNRPDTGEELKVLQVRIQRGRPFGEQIWVTRMA
jgi:putative transposase